MAVLNRQMFRQPFPVVRRQLGTPPEGEIIDDVVLTEKMFKDSQGIGDKIGTYGKKIGSGILNALKFNPMKDLIEKTNEIIRVLNERVGNQSLDPNKAAEIVDIITTERQKSNPNMELLNKFYEDIVVGVQEFEEGYETWQNEQQQLRDDTMHAEEFMNTPMAVERQMGSPPMGEQVNANNVGIMDGFEGEQVAQQVMVKGSAAKDEIDQASTYDELMQSIRGDDLSEHDRRQELASVVGEKDAYETPDSVLALVQPVMQMMDTETANTGIGQIEEGQQMANVELPQRPVGIANGGYLRKIPGYAESDADGVTMDDTELDWTNIAQRLGLGQPDLETTYEEKLPLYTDILKGSAASPDVLAGQTWGDISQAAFAWGQGASPGEAMNFLTQSLTKRAALNDKEKRAMDVQLKLAALKAAEGDVQLEKTLLNKIETKKLEQDAKDKKGTSYVKSLIGQTEEAPIYAEIPGKFDDIVGLNELIATLTEGTTVFLDHNDKLTITPPTLDPKGTSYLKTADSVIPTAFGEIEGLVDVIGTLPIGTNIFVDKNDQVKITEPTKDEKGTSYVKSRINEAEHGEEPIYADIPTKFEAIAGLNDLIGTLPEGTNIHVDSKNKTFITLPTVADSEAYYDKTQLKVIFLTDAQYDANPNKGNLTTVGEGTTWVKVIMPQEKDHTKAKDIQLFNLQKWIDKGYVMVPNSKVSIGHEQIVPSIVQNAEGGIVHRSSGTSEFGEIAGEAKTYTVDEISEMNLEEIEKFRKYHQQPLETPAARDDALALVTGGSNALGAIHDLKTLLSGDMSLAGMPGQVIESWRNIFLTLDYLDNEVLGDKVINKEGDLYKFMDKEKIEEVKALKQQIGDALADLRFMKGQTRMTPTRLIEESQKQADVTGWMMPPKVALQKLDALATRLAKLTKDYTVMSGVYLKGLDEKDPDYGTKYMRNLDNRLVNIDNLVTAIHAIQVGEGDQPQKSYTIEELQQIIQAQ